ncbi:50S ribosomal protein L29 [Candidatus Parcubacteria bacterium]|nr:50S ribosomal protein L29 [Candidatus Parcubacteria bacterium]
MKAKELREQSENQLQILVKDSKEKLKSLRFSLANKQLKDYSEIKKTKKIVAMAKSVLGEKRTNNKK